MPQNKQAAFKPQKEHNTFPKISKSQVLAMKSLGAGVATKDQQIEALKWIVESGCMYYSMTFNEDNTKLQDLGEGRRFVGFCIQEILTTPTRNLETTEDDYATRGSPRTGDEPGRSRRNKGRVPANGGYDPDPGIDAT